jgi:hypothetical protein
MAHHSSTASDPREPAQQFFICKICRQAIAIETCKTDEKGQPVHEACYLARLNSADMEP